MATKVTKTVKAPVTTTTTTSAAPVKTQTIPVDKETVCILC